MGRWVTSKGRRIYIPDEGEENPYAKKDDISMRKSAGKTWVAHKSERGKKAGVRDLDKPFNTEEEAIKFADTLEGKGQDDTSKIIADNEAKKEKELAANKAQAEKASEKATTSTRELSDKNYAELYGKTMKGKGKDGKSVTVEFQRGADYYMRKLNKLDPADPLYKKTEQYLAHMGHTKVNGRWQYNEKQAQAHVKETEKLVAKQFGLSKYEIGKTLNENYELYGKKRKKS